MKMHGRRHLQAAARVPVALLTCLFLAAAASCAVAAPPTDNRLDALLTKVEQQIAAGRFTGPTADNALDTWSQVLAMNPLSSPSAQTAIESFAADMFNHATAEAAAGQASLSVDYSVFAQMAEEYLRHANDGRSGAGPNAAPAETASVTSQEAQARPPPLSAASPPPASLAVAPLPTVPLPAAPPAAASPPARDPPIQQTRAAVAAAAPEAGASIAGAPGPVHQDQATAELYSARGDAMMAVKDITAARRLYEFAANAGSARAASALASTYDPAGLRRLGAIGLKPNPGLAELWYRRAEALGDPGAEARLNSLAHETPD
jgi:TPR repeat protein